MTYMYIKQNALKKRPPRLVNGSHYFKDMAQGKHDLIERSMF